MRLIFFKLLFYLSAFSFSQSLLLTENADISILTIGPGEGLVDKFGHTGIRVKDTRSDYIFNYGVYDFDDPNFYTKFAQGRLRYKLGVQSATSFIASYKRQNRWIKSQILNLTQEEKQQLFDFLINNAKPENEYYLYDYFENNCATKPYDILKETLGANFNIQVEDDSEKSTYRKLIHSKISQNSWGSFGIDLALGSLIDRPLNWELKRFLPEYVHDYLAKAKKLNGNALVAKQSFLFSPITNYEEGFNLFNPLLLFSLISVFILFITRKDFINKKRTKWLDVLLFSVTGLIGIVLMLLWFATDHKWTAFNYNLLWAFPINILAAIQLFKTQSAKWVKSFIKLLLILFCLMSLHWLMGLQLFPVVIIPIILALAVRYVFLVRTLA